MSLLTRRNLLGAAAVAPLLNAAQSKSGTAAKGGAKTPAASRVHPLDNITREDLKITDVKVTIMSYELPPERQWVTARYLTWKTDCVLVQVFTDKGIVGIGESSPYGGPEYVKKSIEDYVKPAILGLNPFDVEHFATAWAGQRPSYIVWAGIDAACWDIIGKAKNMPVYKLLATDNEPQPHIRMYASGGVEYAWYKRPEDLLDEAVRYKEAGYTAFKFRLGSEWASNDITVKKFIPFLRKMRELVGPNFDLMQESNKRLSLQECLELAPVLEELKFHWFEEPINTDKPDSIDGYLKIAEAMPTVLVSGGESLGPRFDFKPWIDRGAYEIVQPDCNVTGITEAWHIARIAHLKKRWCCPHNWHGGLTTMANAHFVAGIPNRHMLELNQTYNPFKEEIFVDPLLVKKGYMDLHNKPGFGMEVKPGIEKKHPYIPGTYSKPNPYLSK